MILKNIIALVIVLIGYSAFAKEANTVECPVYWNNNPDSALRLTGAEILYRQNVQAPDNESNPEYNEYSVGGAGYTLRCFYFNQHVPIFDELYDRAYQLILPIPENASICRDGAFKKGTVAKCF